MEGALKREDQTENQASSDQSSENFCPVFDAGIRLE